MDIQLFADLIVWMKKKKKIEVCVATMRMQGNLWMGKRRGGGINNTTASKYESRSPTIHTGPEINQKPQRAVDPGRGIHRIRSNFSFFYNSED